MDKKLHLKSVKIQKTTKAKLQIKKMGKNKPKNDMPQNLTGLIKGDK
jgi:hypothetical protein